MIRLAFDGAELSYSPLGSISVVIQVHLELVPRDFLSSENRIDYNGPTPNRVIE